MKINPTDKLFEIKSPNKEQSMGGAKGESDFASILGKTVQSTSAAKVQNSLPVRSLNGPEMSIHHDHMETEFGAANGLLDALEGYQKLLGNPNADLKRVEPMVRKMKALLEQTDPVVNKMPDSHPLKSVAQEALMHMAKEIARFDSGHYVDN